MPKTKQIIAQKMGSGEGGRSDWDNQVTLYNTIRSVAPNTFTLLGSFMGFAGDPTFGANYLASNGVDWSNAGFAHHGYESKAGIENAIDLMQQNTSFPATLSTEFFPGDTNAQGYNSMYESKFNGWMQFQWLGADDEDLHDFRSKIIDAGTVWTPDDPNAIWSARGTLDMPADGSLIGLYSRDNEMFISANPANGSSLKADLASYTGAAHDQFIFERINDRFFSLKAQNGFYVSTTNELDSLTANRATVGPEEMFEFIRLANGDVALRSFGGGGHLVQRNSNVNLFYPNGDSGREAAASFVLVDSFGSVPDALIGDPFYCMPQMVPGIIQAEDFDLGGQGQSYNDTDPTNNGGKYRTLESVDIEATTDIGGGYNLGWLGSGEWLEYTIDVNASTTNDYVLTARVATQNSGGAFSVSFDGTNQTGTLSVPNTGNWQSWTDVTTVVSLDPGEQIMRFSRLGIAEFNLNYFSLSILGDLNGDMFVDSIDLGILLGNWGQSGLSFIDGNLNGTGVIDSLDLGLLLAAWSPPPLVATTNIPEPIGLILIIMSCACFILKR